MAYDNVTLSEVWTSYPDTSSDTSSDADHVRQRTLQACSIISIATIGIFGNLLVLTAIVSCGKLRTPPNVFVANLALANILLCVMLFLAFDSIMADRNVYNEATCTTWGFVMVIGSLASNYTMAAVAVNRYMLIAHVQSYQRVFRLRRSLLIASLLWLVSGIVAVATLTGWGGISYNAETGFCSYERTGNHQYFLLCFGFVIPLSAVCMSYTFLYRAVRRSRRRIMSNVTSVGSRQAGRRTREQADRTRKEAKLTLTLFTICIVYAGLMGPFFVLNMIDAENKKYPENTHKLITWIGLSTNAVNPFIYAFVNKQFRDGFVAILMCRFSRGLYTGQTAPGEPMVGAHATIERVAKMNTISDGALKK